MVKQTDDQVAVSMVRETKQRFSTLSTCSFDRGFHSPENQTDLAEILDVVALVRKGKKSGKIRANKQPRGKTTGLFICFIGCQCRECTVSVKAQM
jgi:hypothetical protein